MVHFINYENRPYTQSEIETREALKTMTDDDIVFDEDCPELSPAMLKQFQCAVNQRNRLKAE